MSGITLFMALSGVCVLNLVLKLAEKVLLIKIISALPAKITDTIKDKLKDLQGVAADGNSK